jgi:CheY-like chemotaxis protein
MATFIPMDSGSLAAAKPAHLQELVARCVPEHPSSAKQFSILIIDDNPEDIRLLRLALKWMRFSVPITVRVSLDCAASLEELCSGENVNLPSIIVLNLDLADSGKQCLKSLGCLKQDQRTRSIPVIAISSQFGKGISEAYSAHANCVVPKPTTVEEAENLLARIERFWFSTAVLSPASRPESARAREAVATR